MAVISDAFGTRSLTGFFNYLASRSGRLSPFARADSARLPSGPVRPAPGPTRPGSQTGRLGPRSGRLGRHSGRFGPLVFPAIHLFPRRLRVRVVSGPRRRRRRRGTQRPGRQRPTRDANAKATRQRRGKNLNATRKIANDAARGGDGQHIKGNLDLLPVPPFFFWSPLRFSLSAPPGLPAAPRRRQQKHKINRKRHKKGRGRATYQGKP